MKTSKFIINFCALTFLFALSGCAIPYGEKIDIASAEHIVIGSTKKSDIVKKYGQPQVRNNTNDFDMWEYKYEVESGNVLTGTTGNDITRLAITFKDDVVVACRITRTVTSLFSSNTMDSHECGKGGK